MSSSPAVGARPRESDQVNFTDSESRIMPTSSTGWQQAYILQSSVDMNSYMILGGYACQSTNDKQQLEPALGELEAPPDCLGTLEKIAADTGYFSEENVEEVSDREFIPYSATGPPPVEATPIEALKWRLKTKKGESSTQGENRLNRSLVSSNGRWDTVSSCSEA